MLPSTFIPFGYSYKIEVQLNDTVLSFEKDDEGSWRAMLDASLINNNKISKELIAAIIQSLDSVT